MEKQNLMNSKNRIDWIDTAKGFTILLVVLGHTTSINYTGFGVMLFAFRMPLYYFLSGLFFKTYDNFQTFLKKKLNNLIVPSLFFYWVGCLIYLVFQKIGVKFALPDIRTINFFDPFFPHEKFYCQGVIWFLFSLFEVNIICFFLKEKLKGPLLWIVVIALAILGYYVQLPYFIDTSLVAIPIFMLGGYFKRYLEMEIDWKKLLVLIALSVLWLFVFAQKIDMKENVYEGYFFMFYVNAAVGIFMILCLSKLIGNVPFLASVLGRYSIVILLTHGLAINPMRRFSVVFGEGSEIFTFISVLIISSLCVPICIKVIPYFCAQKNFFDWIKSKFIRTV